MNTQQTESGNMRAITISRQYGSGGGEIATRLAEVLSWQLIDHSIVVQAAQTLRITTEEAEARDERVESRISRAFRHMPFAPVTSTGATASDSGFAELGQDSYEAVLRQIVESAAERGKTVIVGRGGQAVLAARADVLHVRIVAPISARVTYVALREGIDEAKAEARIIEKDRNRARFLDAVYHRRMDDPELYDLIINTGFLSLDMGAELIRQALEDKARTLALPYNERGPVRGLVAYPGKPVDLQASSTQSNAVSST